MEESEGRSAKSEKVFAKLADWSAPVSGAATFADPPAFEKLEACRARSCSVEPVAQPA